MTDDYFSDSGGGTPTKAGHFADLSAAEPYELAPGIMVRAVLGDRALTNLVEMRAGSEAPHHSHAEEQTVVVLEGEVEIHLGEEIRALGPGQAVVIPPWVRHAAYGRAPTSRTVEVFSPPRAALLSRLGFDPPAPNG